MPYKIKSKDNETIVVGEAELFRLFLSKARASEELKEKINDFVNYYGDIIDTQTMIELPLKEMMVTFFVLGYQFANFELKNDVEYEKPAKVSKETNQST